MIRGEAPALWILSKMGMLFFIISLAAILLVASAQWRSSLCSSQAFTLAQTVSGSISSILNSPVEDERRVLALPSTLQDGNGVTARYGLNISELTPQGSQSPTALVVQVYSQYDSSCSAGIQLSFNPSQVALYEVGPRFDPNGFYPQLSNVLEVQPSLQLNSVNPPPAQEPSKYISLVKCQAKNTTANQYLFIEDCVDSDASSCLGLASAQPENGNAGQSTPQSLCGYTATPNS